MEITIQGRNAYYILSKELAETTFFKEIISYMNEHKQTYTLNDYEDEFIALNTNLHDYICKIYSNDNDEQIISSIKRLKEAINYFHYDIGKFNELVEDIDDYYYNLRINEYITGILRKYKTTVKFHQSFTEEFYAEFDDLIDYSDVNLTQYTCANVPLYIIEKHFSHMYVMARDLQLSIINENTYNYIFQTSTDFVAIDKYICSTGAKHKYAAPLAYNKHLPEWFVEKHIKMLLFSGIFSVNRAIMQYACKFNMLDGKTYMFVQHVPRDYLISHVEQFGMIYFDNSILRHNEIFTLNFSEDQLSDLGYCEKVPVKFVEENYEKMGQFNCTNLALSKEFILKNITYAWGTEEQLSLWKITDEFAIEIYNAIIAQDGIHLYNVDLIELAGNIYLQYDTANLFQLLTKDNYIRFQGKNYDEYIRRNIDVPNLPIRRLPLNICKELNITHINAISRNRHVLSVYC